MLSTAENNFRKKIEQMVKQRKDEWETKKADFLNKEMEKLKEQIMDHAKAAHRKDENLRILREKEAERKRRDEEIRIKNKEEKQDAGSGEPGNTGDPEKSEWARPARKQPQPESPGEKPKKDKEESKKQEGGFGFLNRDDMKKREVPKQEKDKKDSEPSSGFKRSDRPAAKGPPKFTKGDGDKKGGEKDNDTGAGFGFRNTNAAGRGKGRK